MATSAGIIIIGNEILSGKVEDANSHYLCEQLRELGVAVECIITLPDDADVVARHVEVFSKRYDYVFTTGGVGPTHDDVTLRAVAQAFNMPVVRHPDLEQIIRRFYREESFEASLRMADVPQGATLVNEEGLFFPVVTVDNVYIFPGVPDIFRKKFDIIKERFRDAPYFLKRVYLQEGESIVAGYLDELLVQFPDLLLGSYPMFDNPEYQVLVTLESKDRSYLEQAFAKFLGFLSPQIIVRVE